MRAVVVFALVACSGHESPRRVPATTPSDARVEAAIPTSSQEPPTLRLPATATPLAYNLRLELDPDRESFAGAVDIKVRLDQPTDRIWLHAVNLELESAVYRTTGDVIQLRPLDPAGHGLVGFAFATTLPAGPVTLAFTYTGHPTSRDDEGLFRQQAGGRWFLYAQSQAMFARKILPCFDEPRFRPAWRVTITAPEKQIAIANGAVTAEAPLADGRREWTFAEVAAMPSYLFALAVGPFTVLDAGRVGRDHVPVHVAVAPGDAKAAGVAKLKIGAITEALERYLGRALPLAKLDLVAVPHFFGAMENTGIITLDASILVGDARSVEFQQRFTKFLAHELAHQWFGNSATPAWWDDLWLSEAFATWLADKIATELDAYDDAPFREQLARLRALEADDKPDPRPLRREIATTDDVDDRFDAISYEKGGAVLAMLEQFTGEPEFQRGIRAYLDRHAGRTVTAADVLASVPASESLRWYLDHAGAPLVTVTPACAATAELEVTVDHGSVPVCVRTDLGRACRMVTGSARIPLTACPRWVIGNAGGLGYYRVRTSPGTAVAAMTASERLAHGDDVAAALLREELTLAGALTELTALARGDAGSQLAALEVALAIDPLVDDATRPAWSRWLAVRFAKRLSRSAIFNAATPAELELRTRLVAIIPERADATSIASTRALVDRSIALGFSPPGFALAIAATAGGKGFADKLVALAVAAPDDRHEAILENLGAVAADQAPRVVELLVDPRFKPARVWPAVEQLLQRPATRTATWSAIVARHAKLTAALARVELDAIVEAAAALCDPAAVADLATFETDPAIRERSTRAIERCVRRRTFVAKLPAAVGKP
ncbi:MAG: M1 family metallopeptidase [Kofleriaceae bacterium]